MGQSCNCPRIAGYRQQRQMSIVRQTIFSVAAGETLEARRRIGFSPPLPAARSSRLPSCLLPQVSPYPLALRLSGAQRVSAGPTLSLLAFRFGLHPRLLAGISLVRAPSQARSLGLPRCPTILGSRLITGKAMSGSALSGWVTTRGTGCVPPSGSREGLSCSLSNGDCLSSFSCSGSGSSTNVYCHHGQLGPLSRLPRALTGVTQWSPSWGARCSLSSWRGGPVSIPTCLARGYGAAYEW